MMASSSTERRSRPAPLASLLLSKVTTVAVCLLSCSVVSAQNPWHQRQPLPQLHHQQQQQQQRHQLHNHQQQQPQHQQQPPWNQGLPKQPAHGAQIPRPGRGRPVAGHRPPEARPPAMASTLPQLSHGDKSCGNFARPNTGLGMATRGLPRKLYECRSSTIGTVPFGQFQRIFARMTWNIVLPVNKAGRAATSVLYWNVSIVFDLPIQVRSVDGSTLITDTPGIGAGHFSMGRMQGPSVRSTVQRFEGTSSFKTISGFTAPLVSYSFEYYNDGLTAQTISTVQAVIVSCEGCETILYLRPDESPTKSTAPNTPIVGAPNLGWGNTPPAGHDIISDLSGPRQGEPPNPLDAGNSGPARGSWNGLPPSRSATGNRGNRKGGGDKESSGGGSGTAAGVTITLILLVAGAVAGYCIYRKRSQARAGTGNQGPAAAGNIDSERSWKGRLSLAAANAWLVVSGLHERIIPDRFKPSGANTAVPNGHGKPPSQMPHGSAARNNDFKLDQTGPPRPPHPSAVPFRLRPTSTAPLTGGGVPTLEGYDDVLLNNRVQDIGDYGSTAAASCNYGGTQQTVIDYEDVGPDDVVEMNHGANFHYHADQNEHSRYG